MGLTDVVGRLGSSGLACVTVGGVTNERMLIFHTGRRANKRSAGHTGKNRPNHISHAETAVFTTLSCIQSVSEIVFHS